MPIAVALLCAWHKFPASFEGQTLDWEKICQYDNVISGASLTHSEWLIAGDMIAQFIKDIGKSQYLDVDYGADGSSAYPSNIPRTLRALGFSKGGYYSWDNYSTAKIYEELRAGYPVLVGGGCEGFSFLGIEIQTGGGHRWLIDELLEQTRAYNKNTFVEGRGYVVTPVSYETRLLVHCNMGWNGTFSGYYYCGRFDTTDGVIVDSDETNNDSDENLNFRYWLNMVTGIRK